VRAALALVDVVAGHTVARVARRALAAERSRQIGAVRRAAEAVVRTRRTLVDLDARDVGRVQVALQADARAVLQMRCVREAAQALDRCAATAGLAAAVARSA